MSILITSCFASIWWTYRLHQTGTDNFPQKVIHGIIVNTEEDDTIYTNLIEQLDTYQYYTYRKIIGKMTDIQALDRIIEDTTSWYLLCSSSEQNAITKYNGVLEDHYFIAVEGECRLIRL